MPTLGCTISEIFCNSVCDNGTAQSTCGGRHTFKDNQVTETFFSVICIDGDPGKLLFHFGGFKACFILVTGGSAWSLQTIGNFSIFTAIDCDSHWLQQIRS